VAPRAVNCGGGEPSLASLTERSTELKRALVDFALSLRFERHLEQFMVEAADPCQELSEGEAVGVIEPVRASAPPAERQDRAGPVRGRPAGSDRG